KRSDQHNRRFGDRLGRERRYLKPRIAVLDQFDDALLLELRGTGCRAGDAVDQGIDHQGQFIRRTTQVGLVKKIVRRLQQRSFECDRRWRRRRSSGRRRRGGRWRRNGGTSLCIGGYTEKT